MSFSEHTYIIKNESQIFTTGYEPNRAILDNII